MPWGAEGIAGAAVFAGADAGPDFAGADFAGAFCRSKTLPEDAAPRVARIANVSEVIMKIAAAEPAGGESRSTDSFGPA